MTQQACTPRPPRRKPWPRVPPFYPVPALRSRRGGWSPQRQADFLGFLAETGSVLAACERVGLSREAAYKLRRRPGAKSFAAAWDAALGAPVRKVTHPDAGPTANSGQIRITMEDGRYVGAAQESDDSMLLRMLDRWDRMFARRLTSESHFRPGFVSAQS